MQQQRQHRLRQYKIYPRRKVENNANRQLWRIKCRNRGRCNKHFCNCKCGSALTGLNKFGSQYNWIQKLFWLIALCISYGLCVWQVYMSAVQFLSYPIGVVVTVEPIEKFNFPAITICPKMSKSSQYFQFNIPLSQRCKNKNSTCFSLKNTFNISLIDLWNDEQVRIIKEYTGDRTEKAISKTAKFSYVDTHIGKCILLYREEKFIYSGKGRKRWTIYVEGINTYSQNTFDMVFSLHSSKTVNRYNTYGDPLNKNKYLYAELYMKKLNRVNSKQKPCLKEDDAVDCINKCFDSMFKNKNIVCKLPYAETVDLDICDTLEQANNFQRHEIDMQQKLKCNCPRACETILYTTDNQIMKTINNRSFENASVISMVMWRPFCDIVTEFFDYTFSDLLTSLAGNVGFFLGVSLLNMFEIFHRSLVKK